MNIQIRSSIGHSALRRAFILITLTFGCAALVQKAQAVNPPPDGGYPNFNTEEGQNALFGLTTGQWNTALGAYTLWHNTDGSYNTAVGTAALLLNVGDQGTGEGRYNTAVGAAALLSNATGRDNTAVGAAALLNNTVSGNTAIGSNALLNNTTGGAPSGAFLAPFEVGPNTAVGSQALSSNVDGGSNVAVGYKALGSMVSGVTFMGNSTLGGYSTAVGFEALASAVGNATGQGVFNDAFGYQTLAHLTTGEFNLGIGNRALFHATTGSLNTAVGEAAGFNVTTGSLNVFVGASVGVSVTTASNVIAIGSPGANVTNSCFIGNIRGVTTANMNAIPVLIDSAGQLGTASSSKRYKNEIKPMDSASESILSFKPVTFHYKSDSTGTPQFGLIAEEVAEVDPDLVVRDDKGDIYTVRYDAVNAMLLNEFLKEHRKVQELETTVTELGSTASKQDATIAQLKQDFQFKLAEQQKQIKALTTGLQRASNQLAAASPSDSGLEPNKLATGRIRRGGPAPRIVAKTDLNLARDCFSGEIPSLFQTGNSLP